MKRLGAPVKRALILESVLGLVALTVGCAATYRTIGMKEPSVEIVRALAAAQTSAIKALTDALTRAQATACPTPEVIR